MELTDVDAVDSFHLAHDPNYQWHVATAVQELCEQPLVVARERHEPARSKGRPGLVAGRDDLPSHNAP